MRHAALTLTVAGSNTGVRGFYVFAPAVVWCTSVSSRHLSRHSHAPSPRTAKTPSRSCRKEEWGFKGGFESERYRASQSAEQRDSLSCHKYLSGSKEERGWEGGGKTRHCGKVTPERRGSSTKSTPYRVSVRDPPDGEKGVRCSLDSDVLGIGNPLNSRVCRHGSLMIRDVDRL